MSAKTPLWQRWAAAGGTAVLALAAAGAWLARDYAGGDETVLLVDHAERFDELLAERARAGEVEAGADLLVLDEGDRAELARIFQRVRDGIVPDPVTFYRREGGVNHWRVFEEHPDAGFWVRSNSLGMRNDGEPLVPPPNLRVLVTGDSHTDGVCANEESFCGLLGDGLRLNELDRTVEVLNTGTGGYTFYHYLGVLERHLELGPDVFVAVVYGGNDFSGAIKFQRYFRRRPPPVREPFSMKSFARAGVRGSGVESQEMVQLSYFLNNPQDVDLAVQTATALSRRMAELCERAGCALVLVYLPGPLVGQPRHHAELIVARDAHMGEHAGEPDPAERIADAWLARCADLSITALDLRPLFRASSERLYWESDSHINLAGHALVARELLPLVEAAVARR
ncbi:MAG: SGNH/GDSL hydrolase family protein [Planctomycetota bacterium]|jgi:lysophospholipase L1-like esterase|nr:SGNH/GDSL hydrolase family protein [Planctomycetota bacterium]MDP6763117.1 SGNH/GDSL hydrolase family protein [Planctomycetota bacterium]MDP6989517.1 SGNH/GDSL hydrolase family protein [Planctomycetota bacterium]